MYIIYTYITIKDDFRLYTQIVKQFFTRIA